MQDLDKEASYQSLLEARRVLDEFGNNCEIAEDIQLFNDKLVAGSLSMTSVRIG